MKFGEFLKQQRERNQWTQPQAAETIGIEQSYLSKLENNKAIPSPDIFDKLLTAYQFEIKELGELMNDSELDKLKDIVLVRDFIITSKKHSEGVRRRWLVAGLLMLMTGAGLLTNGVVSKNDNHVNYVYESKGELNDGESRLLFTGMPNYREYASTMKFPDDSRHKEQLVANALFPRLDYKQMKTGTFHGEFIDDGNRRYTWVDKVETQHTSHFYLGLSIGSMLLVGGLASLFISRRW